MLQCFPTTFVKLGRLRFGHDYPGGTVNIRVPTRADGEKLAPLIKEDGLLQALCVCPDPDHGSEGPYYAIVGGRRLMGLHVLREAGHVDDETPVSVVIANSIDAASALAKSLMAEDSHVPPHPVDRFDAFHALSEKGMSAEQIAARFFIPDSKIVRQALALGALAPEIRAAWRAGEITAEIAQNFTLADGPEHQVKALAKLRKKSGTLEHVDVVTVRKLFTGSEAEANRLLKFVGRNEYVAAGGALTEDLFTTSIVVHDFAKLKRLAEEKLEIECTRLTKGEGWAFAEVQLKPSYMHVQRLTSPKPEFTDAEKMRNAEIKKRIAELDASPETEDEAIENAIFDERERLEEEADAIKAGAEARSYKPEQRRKAGCIVKLTSAGAIEIDPGVVKPKEEPAGASPARPRTSEPGVPDLDYTARRALADWRGAAAGEALARNERLALAAFLASFELGAGPIALTDRFGGNQSDLEFTKAKTLKGSIDALLKLPVAKLYEFVVLAIADCVDLDEDDGPFIATLDDKIFAGAMKRNFDAKIYFKGASKPYILSVIEEALGPDEKRRNEGKSQTDLAKFGVDSVAALGWLPPELRTESYIAPKPKAAAAVPPSKPAAKPSKAKPAAKTKTKIAAAAKKPAPAKKAKAKGKGK